MLIAIGRGSVVIIMFACAAAQANITKEKTINKKQGGFSNGNQSYLLRVLFSHIEQTLNSNKDQGEDADTNSGPP
jgi:hypothetical protein